jgi:hypothetical protein
MLDFIKKQNAKPKALLHMKRIHLGDSATIRQITSEPSLLVILMVLFSKPTPLDLKIPFPKA